MQLFYNNDINYDTKDFLFNKEESRHIVRVLRKKEGDTLHITNGQGFLFSAEITSANDKKCVVTIVSSEEKKKNWNYHLHIAIAPTKMNDRFEWFLEKATEIGIDEITPLLCENSERKIIKPERFEKVIVSAMKQSLKFQMPKLNAAQKFSDFVSQSIEGIKFIAHCEETDKKTLQNQLQAANKITILIGPEGDFSTKEITKALQRQYIPLSLGENRLRTETAGIVVCNTVSVLKSLP